MFYIISVPLDVLCKYKNNKGKNNIQNNKKGKAKI
jgi:hypothetical protein